jgi:predicted nuclease of predicted toxin-antitoxin system
MRFLADENFPGAAVRALRQRGFAVDWVREISPGAADEAVLAWAIRESAVILTFDKDFGELAWRARLPATCGIILFRTRTPKAAEAGSFLTRLVEQRDDWCGHLTVIEPGRLRMRAFARD